MRGTECSQVSNIQHLFAGPTLTLTLLNVIKFDIHRQSRRLFWVSKLWPPYVFSIRSKLHYLFLLGRVQSSNFLEVVQLIPQRFIFVSSFESQILEKKVT